MRIEFGCRKRPESTSMRDATLRFRKKLPRSTQAGIGRHFKKIVL
jgi:hypothetical protein